MKDFCWPDFYVGADVGIRDMKFQPAYGGSVYKSHDYPQAGAYLGIMGNEYIGLEAGYEASRGRTHTTHLPAHTIFFGATFPSPLIMKTVARVRGFHSSIIGSLPVFDNKDLKLIMSVGFSNLHIRLENTVTQIKASPVQIRGILCQSKIVLRLMTGLQYTCTDRLGIRANVRWENTARVRNIEAIRSNNSPFKARAKNSFGYGLGVFVNF